MRLVTLLAAGGLAYAAYLLLAGDRRPEGPRRRMAPPPRAGAGDGNRVRDAGPAERDADRRLGPLRDWDEVDEASDESFPASDPPARW